MFDSSHNFDCFLKRIAVVRNKTYRKIFLKTKFELKFQRILSNKITTKK